MKNFNFFQVLKVVVDFIKKGYQLRLAGGVSKDGTKNSTIVPAMIDSYKTLFLAIVPYELYVKTNQKDESDGNVNLFDVEDPVVLAINKLKYEIGFSAKYGSLKEIYNGSVPDNRYNDGRLHHKYLYVVEEFEGKFVDLSNNSFLTRETLGPIWVPARILPDFLFEGHLDFLERIIEYFYSQDRLNRRDYFTIKESIIKRKLLLSEGMKLKFKIAGCH